GASAPMETPVDMMAVIRECSSLGSADANRIDSLVTTDAQILGEYGEITSVTSNLISNALRYSADDAPVEVSWSEDDDGWCVLRVSDKGDGISPEDVPRLTERFFRVNRGRGRDSGGTGLGLAIVKHALVRHDADFEIDTEIGQGSTFSCRFPPERLRFPSPGMLQSESVGQG
ncbi:MAG: ATP-binding protein, partial [Pseudomonadota bacterium]